MKTKDKIILAAKDIFHQKGYDGARMQEIAAAIREGQVSATTNAPRARRRLFAPGASIRQPARSPQGLPPERLWYNCWYARLPGAICVSVLA